jgi:tetratricopeptide (TPR) repeat protein
MKKDICVFLTGFIIQINCICTQAQTIDSLKGLLQIEKQDSTRCLLLEQLSGEYLHSKPDTAIRLAQQGLALATRVKFTRGEVEGLYRTGEGFQIMGNDAKALDLLFQSLKKSESINNQLGMKILRFIGDVYDDQGDEERALEYTLKARNIAFAIKDEFSLTICDYSIGDSYEKLNQLDSAMAFNERGYALAVKNKYTDLIGQAFANFGNIHSKMHEPVLAKDNYRRSIPYLRKSSFEYAICEVTIGIAKIFEQQQMDDSSLYYERIAYDIAKARGFQKYTLYASKFFANYYKRHHEVDSAYTYLTEVMDAKDSLFNQEKVKEIQNLSFNETIRQQEIAAQRKIAEENHIRNLQLLAIGFFIPIFFIGVLLLSRTKVKPRVVEFLGILSLLLFFEFITELIYPYISQLTNENPIWEMLFLVVLAALLEPINFKLEHWVKEHLVHKPVLVPAQVMTESISNASESEQDI